MENALFKQVLRADVEAAELADEIENHLVYAGLVLPLSAVLLGKLVGDITFKYFQRHHPPVADFPRVVPARPSVVVLGADGAGRVGVVHACQPPRVRAGVAEHKMVNMADRTFHVALPAPPPPL